MITLEDWALIRRLAAQGVPKARIAQRLGISRTTVIKAVNSESPPRYERAARPTFSPFEERVRQLFAETPASTGAPPTTPSLDPRTGRTTSVAAAAHTSAAGPTSPPRRPYPAQYQDLEPPDAAEHHPRQAA